MSVAWLQYIAVSIHASGMGMPLAAVSIIKIVSQCMNERGRDYQL